MSDQNFIYNEALDAGYLTQFYGNDVSRAAMMFQVFIQVIDGEIETLQKYKEAEDWNAFSAQAHKIKPNFMMVGLAELSEMMKLFEGAKKEEELRKMISLQFNEVKGQVVNGKKLVERELQRLKEFNV